MRPFRARSSIASTILDDLDASDDLDVATDVATTRIRDPRSGPTLMLSRVIDFCSFAWRLLRKGFERRRHRGERPVVWGASAEAPWPVRPPRALLSRARA
jgi:hypothetical protein